MKNVNWDKVQKGFVALALAVLLIIQGLGYLPGEEAVARGGRSALLQFQPGGDTLVAASGSEIEFLSGATLDVQSGTTETHANTETHSGAVTFSGSLTLTAWPIQSTASITPTDGGTLTPTAELVTLTPAGALGTALGACTNGQTTTLYNSVNASVVITDTGNGVLGGNATLTQFDTLRLACFATKWVQVGSVPTN